MDNAERAEYERKIWKRQVDTLERIAVALERIAGQGNDVCRELNVITAQGDDVERHLSAIASAAILWRDKTRAGL